MTWLKEFSSRSHDQHQGNSYIVRMLLWMVFVRCGFCGQCSRLSTSKSGCIFTETYLFIKGLLQIIWLTGWPFHVGSRKFRANLLPAHRVFNGMDILTLFPALFYIPILSFPSHFWLIPVWVSYILVSYLKLFLEWDGGINRQTNTVSTAINKNIWNQETQVFESEL